MLLVRRSAAIIMDPQAARVQLEEDMRTHKGKYILQGMIFVICGLLAVIMPAATALNAEMLIGAVLLTTGIFQLVLTLRARLAWWSLISAWLSIGVGLFMLWKPFDILEVVITLLAMFMTAEGLLQLLIALRFRAVNNWSWMLFSALVTLALAVVLWVGFPTFDVMYLGWVIAANLVLYGISLLMLVWKIAS